VKPIALVQDRTETFGTMAPTMVSTTINVQETTVPATSSGQAAGSSLPLANASALSHADSSKESAVATPSALVSPVVAHIANLGADAAGSKETAAPAAVVPASAEQPVTKAAGLEALPVHSAAAVVSPVVAHMANLGAAAATPAPSVSAAAEPSAATQPSAGSVVSTAKPLSDAAAVPHEIAQHATPEQLQSQVVSPVVQHITSETPGYWSGSQWRTLHIWSLLAGITFAMVVKGLCVASNVLVQVSPFPQVMRWQCRDCTGEADPAPFVSIAFGGSQWCFYGLFAWLVTGRSGFLILVQSNLLGAMLGTYYSFSFYHHCRSEESLRSMQKYLSAVSALVLLQMCGICVLPAERALFLTGLVSSFCSFVGATSVLVTIPQVLKSKDSRSIPGPFAFANLCSCIVWSLCGWLLHDPMVLVPALFSMCCSTIALTCKAMYPSLEVAGNKEGLQICSVEDGEVKMGRMLVAKLSKAELPAECMPIKPSPLMNDMTTFKVQDYDGTGGTY